MNMPEFPLLDLFTRLQKAGMPLGMDEYQLVLKSMQSGFGLKDKVSLKQLCSILWVKSEDDQHIFDYHFDTLLTNKMRTESAAFDDGSAETEVGNLLKERYLRWVSVGSLLLGILFFFIFIIGLLEEEVESSNTINVAPTIPQPNSVPKTEIPTSDKTEEETDASKISLLWIGGMLLLISGVCFLGLHFTSRSFSPASDTDVLSINSIRAQQKIIDLDDEVELAQVKESETGLWPFVRLKVSGTEEYFPITQCQLKQGWQYLRHPVREGEKIEIDIDATVQQIGRDGMLLEPVRIPRRTNRIELLLLIDQGGSMVPFQLLSQRLTNTALQSGKLGYVQTFFFNNYWDEYLYTDSAMCDAKAVRDILSQISRQAVVLVFSDAGAARGGLNSKRIKLTKTSLTFLMKHIRYVTWLNPVPQNRWGNTTAKLIAEIVPMFEVDRQGFQKSIDILRGRSGQYPI